MPTDHSAPDVIGRVRAADELDSSTEAPPSTDYFAFYQSAGRWKWQCVGATGEIVVSSEEGFRQYLDCVADAATHGWAGQPLMFLSQVEPSPLP